MAWNTLCSIRECKLTCEDFGRKSVQCVVAGLLFVGMLGAMTFSKISLVLLLGGQFINNTRLETWYAAFALVLIVPELVALVKVFWNTSFIKRTATHQWPSMLAIFVGLMVSVAEVSSFMVFTLEVAPRLPVQVLLPILSSVFSVYLCHHLWEDIGFLGHKKSEMAYDGNFTLKGDDHHHGCPADEGSLHNWKRILKTVIGFSGVWATCAIASILALTTTLPWFQALCLPACLCLLALCWHPNVRVYIVRSTDGDFLGRWKATCLYTFFKIIMLLVGLSIIMVMRLQEFDVMDRAFFATLFEGMRACTHEDIFYPLLVHFTCGIVGHIGSYLAATLCLTGTGIYLPSFLSTPVATISVMYFCLPQYSYLDDVMCYSSGAGIWCACILATLTWLAPFLIKGRDFLYNAEVIMKPFDELFIEPTWNNIFFDQHLILNYQPDGFMCASRLLTTYTDAISRIFICTTMYREADFEMGRLLKSLYKVSQADKLKNIYLESHIFLDKGTQDSHIADFSTQLISLIQGKMEISSHEANVYQTPYGIQLNWTLKGGMPFFIHLKDPAKVKAKKRWSQVMYMSYVLNYRVVRDSSQEKAVPIKTTIPRNHIVDDSIFVGYASDKEWDKNTSVLNKKDAENRDSPCPSDNTECSTPFYLRESRKSLRDMFNIDGMDLLADSTESSARTSSAGLMTERPELLQHVSSDQGIGTSDNISISSSSVNDDTPESSEVAMCEDSRRGTLRAERNEYEGDISSNNESSLTSMKAQQAISTLFANNKELPLAEVLHAHFNQAEKPPRPNRPPHHPPHKKNHKKKRKDSNKSPSPTSEKQDREPKEEGEYCKHDSGCDEPNENPSSNTDSSVFTVSKKSVPSKASMNKKRIPLDDHTYILATDGDMEFNADSVLHLLELCNSDRRLGGACGRTHPIGQRTGPLVWYQKFEYAKDFWMIKSAQNVIGSVMCCPGCFSLYRAGAVRDVISNYAGPTTAPFEVFVKDNGEDRWLCTLMMLNGWKLEYTAFCDNTTYCPDAFSEFVKQRRRWVLSDMANMMLVFRNILKLAQKNDSFSIAYILYMLQMFLIVLMSPASTIVIIAGGLDIVYGIPYEIMSSLLGALVLVYALVCVVGREKYQSCLTFVLTIFLGLSMLLVVIGGAVYIGYDLTSDIRAGQVHFQEYYLILLLVGALALAALWHPSETWLLIHGLSYLLGFPAMQILLPIYAISNMVDQSWGTRDTNKSKSTPVSCFSKHRKKYHKTLSKSSKIKDDAVSLTVDVEEEDVPETPVICTTQFQEMKGAPGAPGEEYVFWERMRIIALGTDVNIGLQGDQLANGLRRLRNLCLLGILFSNAIWLLVLSLLYFNAEVLLTKINVYGLIAAAVYGLVLFVQLLGMSVYRIQACFKKFATTVFGSSRPVWIYPRNRK